MSSENLNKRDVLPTPLSPIKTILYIASISFGP